jgi:hypothetical protein
MKRLIRSALPGIRSAAEAENACKVYACDAFVSELQTLSTLVWPQHDVDISAQLVEINTGANLIVRPTNPGIAGAEILADQCAAGQSVEVSGSTGYYLDPFITSTSGEGGIGFFYKEGSDTRALTILNLDFDSVFHTVSVVIVGSASIQVQYDGGEHAYTGLTAGSYIWINYTVRTQGGVGFECDVELFENFVSKGVVTIASVSNDPGSGNLLRMSYGFLGGNGSWRTEYLAWKEGRLTSGEIASLRDALLRNASTYVDPDPLCGVTVPTPNEDPVPDRFALVWNFEDNNFTWMDASVIDAAELVPVVSMNYGLEPGWQTTWKSLQDHGIIWGNAGDTGLDNLMAGTDEWGDGENPTEWNDFYYAGKEQSMFWLSEVGVSESDQVLDKSGVKKYFAERVAMDFDDALGTTSNTYKHVRQLYPLLESPDSGAMNTYSFSIGWANNLMDDPDYKPGRTIYLNKTSYSGKHKIDTRSTGRYMAMKWDFTYTDEIAMTGVDIDIEESYGR